MTIQHGFQLSPSSAWVLCHIPLPCFCTFLELAAEQVGPERLPMAPVGHPAELLPPDAFNVLAYFVIPQHLTPRGYLGFPFHTMD
jgi:hypothetical protein